MGLNGKELMAYSESNELMAYSVWQEFSGHKAKLKALRTGH